MSSRRQRSIPLSGRNRQVSLYFLTKFTKLGTCGKHAVLYIFFVFINLKKYVELTKAENRVTWPSSIYTCIKKFYWSSHVFNWSSYFFIGHEPRTSEFRWDCLLNRHTKSLQKAISMFSGFWHWPDCSAWFCTWHCAVDQFCPWPDWIWSLPSSL